jgi:transketolase
MKRILEISYKHKLSHIGSCLTMSPILEEIYNKKNIDDVVVLSAGHAGLAQYVEIEKNSNNKINAEDLLEEMGIHPKRDIKNSIYVSSGSLGCGILVAIGLALSDKNKKIYCVLSDGECNEGSVWEALSFCYKMNIINIEIHVNINGFSAYDSLDRVYLENKLKVFLPSIIIHQTTNPKYLGDLNAHYYVLKNENEINKILENSIL